MPDALRGLLSGFTGPASPLLSAGDNEAARQAALRNAGLHILLGVGRGQSPLEAIAGGALAGQEAGAAAQTRTGREGSLQRIRELSEQGAPLEDLFREAIASGDPEMFRALAGVLAAMQGGQRQRERFHYTTLNRGGKPVRVQINEDTGEVKELGDAFAYMNPYRTPTQYQDPVTGEPRLGMYNVFTGEMEPIEDVAPMISGSEQERKAQAFLGFIPDHVAFLDSFDRAPGRVEQALSDRGLGEFTSAETQRLKLASAALAEAWLRMTTGQAYNAEEFANSMMLFQPRPGDKKETIDAKRQNRKRLVQMLEMVSKRLRPAEGSPGAVAEDVDPEVGF